MQKFTTALKNNWTLRKVNWTNEWIVEDPFVWYIDYLDHSKWEIIVLKGYKTDFWTIPRILQPIFNPTAHLAYVLHDYIYENKDELEEYEIKSAKNIIYKKSTVMEHEEIKQFLLKKGYKIENINKAIE